MGVFPFLQMSKCAYVQMPFALRSAPCALRKTWVFMGVFQFAK